MNSVKKSAKPTVSNFSYGISGINYAKVKELQQNAKESWADNDQLYQINSNMNRQFTQNHYIEDNTNSDMDLDSQIYALKKRIEEVEQKLTSKKFD